MVSWNAEIADVKGRGGAENDVKKERKKEKRRMEECIEEKEGRCESA